MDDITIKYGRCVIWIWHGANLTDITITKFKKLLKLAKAGFNNDPAKIKRIMLEMLAREHDETKAMYDSHSVYGKKDHAYFGRKLKLIEKYRKVVEEWDI